MALSRDAGITSNLVYQLQATGVRLQFFLCSFQRPAGTDRSEMQAKQLVCLGVDYVALVPIGGKIQRKGFRRKNEPYYQTGITMQSRERFSFFKGSLSVKYCPLALDEGFNILLRSVKHLVFGWQMILSVVMRILKKNSEFMMMEDESEKREKAVCLYQ